MINLEAKQNTLDSIIDILYQISRILACLILRLIGLWTTDLIQYK